MAKLMHEMTMALPERMQDDIRDLVLDGRGHDWARAFLQTNDALLAKDLAVKNLYREVLELKGIKTRTQKLLVELWKDERLSEQQCARVLDCGLVEFRRLCDASDKSSD